jgi:hypothetical protein
MLHQAELGNRHSQTGVLEREKLPRFRFTASRLQEYKPPTYLYSLDNREWYNTGVTWVLCQCPDNPTNAIY